MESGARRNSDFKFSREGRKDDEDPLAEILPKEDKTTDVFLAGMSPEESSFFRNSQIKQAHEDVYKAAAVSETNPSDSFNEQETEWFAQGERQDFQEKDIPRKENLVKRLFKRMFGSK